MTQMKAISRFAFLRILGCLLLCGFTSYLSAQPEIVPLPIAQETSIERLVEGLRNPKTRVAAVERLHKLWWDNVGDPLPIQPLLAALQDKDPAVRAQVVELLRSPGSTGDQKPIIEALLPLMGDESAPVRARAISTLGSFWRGYRPAYYPGQEAYGVDRGNAPDPRVVAQWTAALQDADADVRRAAAVALVGIGDGRGVEPVLALLQDPDAKKRLQLLEMLSHVTEDRVVAAIIPLLRDPALGSAAAGALCEMKDAKYIDALLDVQQGQDANVRRRVVSLIDRIREPRAIEVLVPFLQDPDAGVRESTMQALVNRADPSVVDVLLKLAKDPEPKQRLSAVQLLGRVKDPRVPDLLAELMTDVDAAVRRQAIFSLAQQGDLRPLEPLTVMQKDKDVKVRRFVAGALEGIKDLRAVDLLLLCLKDPDKYVRTGAMQSLSMGKCQDKRILEPIGKLLKTGDREEKEMAIQTLRDLRMPGAATYLLPALRDPDPQIRQFAGRSLHSGPEMVDPLLDALKDANRTTRFILFPLIARFNDARAIDVMIAALKGADREETLAALRALKGRDQFGLGTMDARIVPTLAALLKNPDPEIRTAATGALNMQGSSQAASALVVALQDPDPKVRLGAVEALARQHDPSMVDPLLIALTCPDPAVKKKAVQALGRIGDRRAIEPLLVQLKGGDTDLRSAVVQAFQNLYGEKVLTALLEACRDKDPRVRAAAAIALQSHRGERATQALLTASKDADPTVRRPAFNSLAQRREARALPDLLARARGGEVQSRIEALQLIGWNKFQDARVEEVVRLAWKDDDVRVRRAALDALPSAEPAWELDILLEAGVDPDAGIRNAVPRKLAASQDPRAQALLRDLLQDANSGVRQQTLYALGEQKAVWAVELICQCLRKPENRERAISALERIGDPRAATEPLIALLADDRERDKQAILQALRQVGDARAIAPVMTLLADADSNISSQARSTLSYLYMRHSQQAKPLLTAALTNPHPLVRAIVVGMLGVNINADTLAGMLGDPDDRVRVAAATGLASQHDARAVEPLLALIENKDTEVRNQAVGALGMSDDPGAVTALLKMAANPDQHVAIRAIYALGQARSQQAIPIILQLLAEGARKANLRVLADLGDIRPVLNAQHRYRGESYYQETLFFKTLATIGVPAVEPCLALLRDAQPTNRAVAGIALRYLRDRRSVSPLCGALRDENATVRLIAARALRDLADARALQPLLAALKGADPDLRLQIEMALGEIGDTRAVEPLLTLLTTGTPDEQYVITRALGQIGAARAIAPLAAFLKTTADAEARVQANFALGKLGDAQAVDRLIAQLDDDDPEVVFQAVRALCSLDGARARESVGKLLDPLDPQYHSTIAIAVATRRLNVPHPTDVTEQLVKLKTANMFERPGLIASLGESGDLRVADALLGLLNDQEMFLTSVIEALGKVKARQAVDPLLRMLEEKKGSVREQDGSVNNWIAWAVGEIGDPRAAAPLWAAYPQQPVEFRGGFIKAFGLLRAPEAFDAVLAVLSEDNRLQRAAAAHALGLYKDTRAVTPLIAALQDNASPWPNRTAYYRSTDELVPAPTVRQEAAWALGEIGDGQAVEPLLALLGTGTLQERTAAAEALGKLKDRRAVPALIIELDCLGNPARQTVLAALKAITGQHIGDDPAAWRDWSVERQAK
ncbi:MAG: HEAT repeat domain-containing protein [Armatimonadota bacterium]